MSFTCAICYEDFCKDKKTLECSSCSNTFCKECVKIHILSLKDQPSCPHCKYIWDTSFCEKKLTKQFMNGPYKKSRIELMYLNEKEKMAKTMKDVENMIKSEEYTEIISEENKLIQKLQRELALKKEKLREMKRTQRNLRKPNYVDETRYKMKCPSDSCCGFLNDEYVCILCDTQYCDKCMEKIESNSGGESKTSHICNPEKLSTYQMIKNECKPCPGCSEMISKINGCDQMWCTKCHVTFSWDTGRVDYGNVHNPHFVEWEKNNGKEFIRQPGEILCGGVPDIKFVKELQFLAINTHNNNDKFKCYDKIYSTPEFINLPIFKNTINQVRFFTWLYRTISNIEMFRAYNLDDYRWKCQKMDISRELRIKFLRKQITEEKFKKSLYRLKMKREKELEILHILELNYVVYVEQINEIYNIIGKLRDDIFIHYRTEYYNEMINERGKKEVYRMYVNYRRNMHIKYVDKIINCIQTIERIIEFSNKNLLKVSTKYNTQTPIVTNTFGLMYGKWKESYETEYAFQEKKWNIQKIQRIDFNIRTYNEKKDVVPVKELFYDQEFNKKITIRPNGSWYFRKNKKNQNTEPDNNINNNIRVNGGIRV